MFIGPAAAAGVMGIALFSLTDFNLKIPSNALTFAVLAGLVISWRRPPVPRTASIRIRKPGGFGRILVSGGVLVFLCVLVLAPVWANLDSRKVEPNPLWLDGDNAEGWFRAAGGVAKEAHRDFQVLARGQAEGNPPAPIAVEYVQKRFARAVWLQSRGLRYHPTSASGHLVLGHLRFSRCASVQLAGRTSPNCIAEAMPEYLAAVQLNPMSAAIHAAAARFLIIVWPLLDPALKSEALSVIHRAVELNPLDPSFRNFP